MDAKVIRRVMVVCVLRAAASPLLAAAAPQVKTTSGMVEGKDEGAVHAFLGIPYAAPPVGDLRWKPPAAVAKWTGVRAAKEFGAHCMQGKVYGDMTFPAPGN